jgi:hypothetical protein
MINSVSGHAVIFGIYQSITFLGLRAPWMRFARAEASPP